MSVQLLQLLVSVQFGECSIVCWVFNCSLRVFTIGHCSEGSLLLIVHK